MLVRLLKQGSHVIGLDVEVFKDSFTIVVPL